VAGSACPDPPPATLAVKAGRRGRLPAAAGRASIEAMSYQPSATDTPFDRLGGRGPVLALAERFYEIMSEREPTLARLHECEADGTVSRGPRDRFALFLVGWLGGPQDYIAEFGHPRLRMRHARVPVDAAMRDAWLRCMTAAMDELAITGEVREFLDLRFADVADFMRNVDR
jgi:hemoglobin